MEEQPDGPTQLTVAAESMLAYLCLEQQAGNAAGRLSALQQIVNATGAALVSKLILTLDTGAAVAAKASS